MANHPIVSRTKRGFPAFFMMKPGMIRVLLITGAFHCTPAPQAAAAESAMTAPQWQEVELTFTATRDTANPYTDSEGWADFTHDGGRSSGSPTPPGS